MSWSWHIPHSLNEVQVGLVYETAQGDLVQEMFNLSSSTSRTVTCRFRDGLVNVWVNGSKPAKCHQQKIKEGFLYYPAVVLKQKGLSAVFNPFAAVPGEKVTYLSIAKEGQNEKESQKDSSSDGIQAVRKVKLVSVNQLSSNKMLLIGKLEG
jgi:hypothetical protein